MKSLSIIFIFILLLHAVSCPQSPKASLRHQSAEEVLLSSFARKLLPQIFPEAPVKRESGTLKSEGGKFRPVKVVVDSAESYVYTYDKKGFPDIRFCEEYEDGLLWDSYRCRSIYDNNGNLVADVYSRRADSAWVNSYRIVNTYNNNNLKLAESVETWKDNTWIKETRYTYTYDGAGYPRSYLFEYFNRDSDRMSVRMNIDRGFYTYDNEGHLLSALFEYWQDGAWQSTFRHAYTYDKDKLVSANFEYFMNGTWTQSSRSKYTYDAGGNLVNCLREINKDGTWRNFERNTYSYDHNSLLIGSLTEKWENNIWVNFSRYSRTSSNNGDLNTLLWELWKGDVWVDSSKCVETLDYNGNTTKAENFTWKDNSWMPAKAPINLSYNHGKDNLSFFASEVKAEYVFLKDEDPPIVHDFSLSQNYPNPFNSSTTINYSVKQDGIVRLSVFNVLGSRVAVILDAFKAKGEYSIRFDGSGFPGGVYFYTIESGGGTLTKKFILLK